MRNQEASAPLALSRPACTLSTTTLNSFREPPTPLTSAKWAANTHTLTRASAEKHKRPAQTTRQPESSFGPHGDVWIIIGLLGDRKEERFQERREREGTRRIGAGTGPLAVWWPRLRWRWDLAPKQPWRLNFAVSGAVHSDEASGRRPRIAHQRPETRVPSRLYPRFLPSFVAWSAPGTFSGTTFADWHGGSNHIVPTGPQIHCVVPDVDAHCLGTERKHAQHTCYDRLTRARVRLHEPRASREWTHRASM